MPADPVGVEEELTRVPEEEEGWYLAVFVQDARQSTPSADCCRVVGPADELEYIAEDDVW